MIEIRYDRIPEAYKESAQAAFEFERRILDFDINNRGEILNGDIVDHLKDMHLPPKSAYLKTGNNRISVVYLTSDAWVVFGETCTREQDVRKFFEKVSKEIR